MTNTYCGVASPISPFKDQIEKCSFAVFKVSSQSVGTKIGYLYHRRQLAVDKQWGFNDVVNSGPRCAFPMKTFHELRMSLSHPRR
jgi:hypothetical protein